MEGTLFPIRPFIIPGLTTQPALPLEGRRFLQCTAGPLAAITMNFTICHPSIRSPPPKIHESTQVVASHLYRRQTPPVRSGLSTPRLPHLLRRCAAGSRLHFRISALLAVTSCWLVACGQPPSPTHPTNTSTPTSPTPSIAPAGTAPHPWLDDGKPQANLPRLRLYLGPAELNAELALSTAAIQKGMMWRTEVPENEAMLFVFARPHQTAFWMKNVPIDIDVAYLDPDGVILEIHRLQRLNTNPVPAQSHQVQFALETAAGWFERRGLGPGTVVHTERGTLPATFFGTRTP